MHMKKLMFAVMGLAAVAGGSARAAGVAVDLHSARAVRNGRAQVRVVDDASAIYFNPAGIAQGQGLEFEIGSAPIIPRFKVTPRSRPGQRHRSRRLPTSSPRPTCTSPAGISDEWTVGLGVLLPYGLKVEWPRPAPGRSDIITTADLKIYDINPTVA